MENRTIETRRSYPTFEIGADLDEDDELFVEIDEDVRTYLTRAGVRELRDRLSAVLDDTTSKPPVPPTLTGMLTFTLTGGA